MAIVAGREGPDAEIVTGAARVFRESGALLVVFWFALAAWLIELAHLGIWTFALHRTRYWHPQALVLGPVAYLILFGGCGILLQLAQRRWPRRVSLRLIITIPAALAFMSVTSLYHTRIGDLPAIILGLGLGIETARHLASRWSPFQRFARRSVWVMAGLSFAVSTGAVGSAVLRERFMLNALPPARAGAPNVLMIILDTVRAISMSLHGSERPTTPELERLAQRGVVFEYAISTAPWTVPSHGALFTGRSVAELASRFETPLPRGQFATLADVLSANGYVSAGFVANLYYTSRDFNLDQGFVHYEDFPWSWGQLVLSFAPGRAFTNHPRLRRLANFHEMLNRKTARGINEAFLHWLDEQEDDRPFFAFLNYFDAHAPYLPPEPYRSRFDLGSRRALYWYNTNRVAFTRFTRFSRAEKRAQRGAYEGAIAALDHELGALFDELARRHQLENTLVIVTSDHGEGFGEHGSMEHTGELHLPLLHVPLVFVFPGRVPAGDRVREPVSLRDVPATVADLVGLDGQAPFPGRSLAGAWEVGGAATSEPLFSQIVANDPRRSVVLGRHHYVRWWNGREELYDLYDDPLETHDLAGDARYQSVTSRMRRMVDDGNREAGRTKCGSPASAGPCDGIASTR